MAAIGSLAVFTQVMPVKQLGLHDFFAQGKGFYVELPEQELSNGLKTYAAYYVPAVHESYISNMPVWDGSFNG